MPVLWIPLGSPFGDIEPRPVVAPAKNNNPCYQDFRGLVRYLRHQGKGVYDVVIAKMRLDLPGWQRLHDLDVSRERRRRALCEINDRFGILRAQRKSDAEVRRVTQEAIAGDHEIAKLLQGLKPGDKFAWPGDGSTATAIESKHKLLEAFHTAIGRFNERFPGAKGFKQVRVSSADEFDTSEIEKMLRERGLH